MVGSEDAQPAVSRARRPSRAPHGPGNPGAHMTDDELRDAYARAMAARTSTTRTGCPRPDALVALVRRDGPEATRLETLDHTMACAACRQEFELLRAIDAGERRASGPAVLPFRWQRPLALAIAASLVLAV